eukprot:g644.t1
MVPSTIRRMVSRFTSTSARTPFHFAAALATTAPSRSVHASAFCRDKSKAEGGEEVAEVPPVPPSEMIPTYEEAVKQRVEQTVTPWEAREEVALVEEDWSAVAPGEEGVLAGTSEYFKGKTCTIKKATNLTVQSSDYSVRHWTIDFGVQDDKWTNPLTGWTSSRDTLRQISPHMKFESAEQAIDFAKRQGWDYEVQEDMSKYKEDFDGEKDYGDNFLTQLAKSKVAKVGEKQFSYGRSANTSAWVNTKRSKYGNEAWSDKKWSDYRNRLKAEGKAMGTTKTPVKDRYGVDL